MLRGFCAAFALLMAGTVQDLNLNVDRVKEVVSNTALNMNTTIRVKPLVTPLLAVRLRRPVRRIRSFVPVATAVAVLVPVLKVSRPKSMAAGYRAGAVMMEAVVEAAAVVAVVVIGVLEMTNVTPLVDKPSEVDVAVDRVYQVLILVSSARQVVVALPVAWNGRERRQR